MPHKTCLIVGNDDDGFFTVPRQLSKPSETMQHIFKAALKQKVSTGIKS